jgi:hypothetical protein
VCLHSHTKKLCTDNLPMYNNEFCVLPKARVLAINNKTYADVTALSSAMHTENWCLSFPYPNSQTQTSISWSTSYSCMILFCLNNHRFSV